jgi:hypothetical protein
VAVVVSPVSGPARALQSFARMRRFAALICLLATGAPVTAGAEPASQEAQLRLEGFELAPSELGELRWYVSGQLTGAVEDRGGAGAAVADVAVAAELAVDSDVCRIVVAGGQARLYRETGDRGLSAEQWASVCISGGDWVPAVQLSHHLEADVRPAYSAPRTLRRRRYSRETIGFDLVEFNFPIPEYNAKLEFAHLKLGVSFVVQDVDDEEPDALEADVDVAMLGWVAPREDKDLRVDIIGVHVREVDDAYYTFVMELSPVRLRGVRLGSGGLYLDADVAWAHGSFSEANQVDSLPLRQYDTVSADVAVERRRGDLWAGASYARKLAPTIDTDLILEDRISGWATLRRERADYTLRAFGAQTILFTPDGAQSDPELTGGVQLSAGLDLGRGMRLGLTGEVARSWYAQVKGESEPRAELAARVVGILSTTIGSD